MANDATSGPVAREVPVAEVTLLEDRARVVRRGVVELPAGLVTVCVEGVSPVLADKTLTGDISAAPGGRAESNTEAGERASCTMVDVKVSRRFVVSYDEPGREPAPDAQALQTQVRELGAEIRALEAEHRSLERHAAGLDKIGQLAHAELAEDVGWGRGVTAAWEDRLDQLSRSERELRERLVELAGDIGERKQTFQRLGHRLHALRNPEEREWAAVEAVVSVARAGTYELSFDYLVPGACWRPYHTAQLVQASKTSDDASRERGDSPAATVRFTTDACVWQNTGEDWRDVQLVLSTERASLGTEPPILDSDRLRVQRKSDDVVVEARDQEIQTAGLGGDDTRARASAELPGIDDGGVVRNFRAQRLATVPADGKPYRVELQAFESDATVELVASPELVECVLQKSVQNNRGDGPILAGPVDLIRQSGFVGRTKVLFIAAGERFELGWGPQPDLRLKRSTEVSEEKSRLLSSWIERTHEVYVMLSNLGDGEHAIRITERLPVSEIDKVKIEVDEDATTDRSRPDDNGIVTWRVTLPARGYQRVKLCYRLKKHEDVVGI